jgi:glycosyltransferase involved in cell wall biosynthesis
MKLVAISRVRNEADIIEAFVRHHASYFDKHIILDDGSCDGTYEALQSLQAEGLPLVVTQAATLGYEQARYMSQLLHVAIDEFGADWVAPLDADEFIEPASGQTLSGVLNGHKESPLSIAWHNFECRPQDEKNPEHNPVVRQRFRLLPRADSNKVLIPARCVNKATEIAQGNHFISCRGIPIASRSLESINLCHFPIRSLKQYAGKIAVAHLQYLAMPNWDGITGFQYAEPFKVLLDGGLEALSARLQADSHCYAMQDGAHCEVITPEENPLRYRGGALKLGLTSSEPFPVVLHYAKEITLSRASLMREELNRGQQLARSTGLPKLKNWLSLFKK